VKPLHGKDGDAGDLIQMAGGEEVDIVDRRRPEYPLLGSLFWFNHFKKSAVKSISRGKDLAT